MPSANTGVLSPGEIQRSFETFQQQLEKAISTTSVTGLQLYRQDLQQEMAMEVPVDTPLRNRIRRVPGQGGAHEWYRLEPTLYAEGKFIGGGPATGVFAPGALPTFVQPTYQHLSAPYRLVGDMVSVTWHDQRAGRSYDDLRANQLRVKMINVTLMEEWAILNGNSQTNPLQFDGLDMQITNTLDYTNIAAYPEEITQATDADYTAAQPFKLFEYVGAACGRISTNGGQARMVVLSYKTWGKLNRVLFQHQVRIAQGLGGMVPMTGVGGGVSFTTFDFGWGEVDLIKSRYVPDYSYGSSIFVLDDRSLDNVNNGNVIQMADLDPLGAVDLGLISTSNQTVIYEDTLLMVTCPAFQYKITRVM